MSRKMTLAVGSAAAAAAIVVGAASLASADSATPSSTASASGGTSGEASTAAAASSDAVVAGDEADKVIAAVQAADADATIATVRKDPDGSYDALGTSGGADVFYDVSADLKTVTLGGGHGGGHGRGVSSDAVVTGDEADKVIAAVKATDADATITTVRKDPDGSYDALGTSGGADVFYDVSADLKTVTSGGGHGGGHGDAPATSPSSTATSSTGA